MRNGFLGVLASLAAGAGLAFGQAAPAQPPARADAKKPAKAAKDKDQLKQVSYNWDAVYAAYGAATSAAASVTPASCTSCASGSCASGSCGSGSCAGGACGYGNSYGGIWGGGYGPVWYPPAESGSCDGGACRKDCGACKRDCCHPDPLHDCLWISADFLLYRIKDGPMPVPLATTSSTLVPGVLPGVIGGTGTSVLLGNTELDYGTFQGGRVTAGFWFDPKTQCLGLEGSAFLLNRQDTGAAVNSSAVGFPVIAVPFVATPSGAASAIILSAPGFAAGGVTLDSSSQLGGADGSLIAVLYRNDRMRVSVLGGGRYIGLDEQLLINDRATALAPLTLAFGGVTLLPGDTTIATDSFITRNRFGAGQLGGRFEYYWDRFYVVGTAKGGIGVNSEEVSVGGATLALAGPGNPAFATTTLPGGILTVPTNSGTFTNNEFAGFAELNTRVGVNLGYGFSAYAGYDVLYLNKVARPGEQIARLVDPTQIPTSPTFTPGFTPVTPSQGVGQSSFWAHGANLGILYRY